MSKLIKKFLKLKTTNKLIIVSCSAIIVLALIGVGSVVYLQSYYLRQGITIQAVTSQATKKSPPPPSSINGHPNQIDIPSLNITVPVIDGRYNEVSKTWTLTLSSAQYLVDSALPNNLSGKTFIYGHYRREVFASLHRIQPGQEAIINTDNGYSFYYRFVNTYATKPSDLSVLANTSQPTLTLQTCSGIAFQNRQMYNFSFEKVVRTT